MINLQFSWIWILAGLLTGTVQGLFFHREDWLGGYGSWPRRLSRLGHIAFFGTGLINMCFAFTVLLLHLNTPLIDMIGWLLILGAVSMSSICYLSAWRKPFRHLFFIPVISLLLGVGLFAYALFTAAVPRS